MLSSKQRKFLRSKAHHLKPVVIIGKADIGDYVIKTVDECLKSHELVKVKFNTSLILKLYRRNYLKN